MARRKRVAFHRRLADYLELPREVVMDAPRLTLIGRTQATIENHRGLVSFSPERVVIAMAGGQVAFEGQDLSIGVAGPEWISVLGAIRHVSFEE